jgi:short-subunit dehydrogenase
MENKKFELNGKTALITGATGLLGMEHATALLESGATVVLTDLSKKELENARNRLTMQFDSRKIII